MVLFKNQIKGEHYIKTSTEKFNKEYIEIVKVLVKNFSDMKSGERMLISSPKSIANYIKKIPYGNQSNVKKMRLSLAEESNADTTCPLTTGIFLRIAIESSLELANGEKPKLPFWRLINQKCPMVKKLPISQSYIAALRDSEGLKD